MRTPTRKAACGCSARRGGRYPLWAHAVAVSASLRLRCGARSRLAPRNSLHSLRSCRSNSLGGSEDEARAARAPTALLRSSPPQKSPPPGTAHRAAPAGPFDDECLGAAGKAVGGCAPAATYAALRNAGLVAARVSAHRSSDSSRLSERSERSERSEFRDGPRDRVPQGTLREAKGVAFERRRIPARGFASLGLGRSQAGAVP
jgi:hypothetical protein